MVSAGPGPFPAPPGARRIGERAAALPRQDSRTSTPSTGIRHASPAAESSADTAPPIRAARRSASLLPHRGERIGLFPGDPERRAEGLGRAGTTKPVSPSRTNSSGPPASSVVRTAFPERNASSGTYPRSSSGRGDENQRAPPRRARAARPRPRAPEPTRSSDDDSFASRRSRSSSGPRPTTTRRAPGRGQRRDRKLRPLPGVQAPDRRGRSLPAGRSGTGPTSGGGW